MILVGAWMVILGYGVMYAGVYKLSHGGSQVKCGLRDAFLGQCSAASAQTSYQPPAGQTASSLPSTVIA